MRLGTDDHWRQLFVITNDRDMSRLYVSVKAETSFDANWTDAFRERNERERFGGHTGFIEKDDRKINFIQRPRCGRQASCANLSA